MIRRVILSALVWANLSVAAEPARNPANVDSPWPEQHRNGARQASGADPGPRSQVPVVQVRRYLQSAGQDLGNSPWHSLGSKKYVDDPNARAVWGSSLQFLYKYIVSGDEFVFADAFRTNALPTWITWNFFVLDGDRVIMPNPNGLQVALGPCSGSVTSLLEFRDGEATDSPIECVHKFELTEARLDAACGDVTPNLFTTGVSATPMFTGEIAVQVVDETPDGDQGYLAIIDNDLTEIITCEQVDTSTSTNSYPKEPLDENRTAMYLATAGGLVKMIYDASTEELTRIWKQEYPFRAGRTGTTPTMVQSGSDRFVVAIDARCAVQDPFTGEITCDEDTSPSKLVSFRTEDVPGPIEVYDLPDFIDTVENSPAALDLSLVVCDYTGYTPDAPKDGVADFATGVAKVSWNPAAGSWQTDWEDASIQCTGIPTISRGSNRVYFSGTEISDGLTYQYGIRFDDDADGAGGERVLRVPVGPARETSPGAEDELFDAGNTTMLNDDGSLIWQAGSGLVRVFDRTPEQAGNVSDGRSGPPLTLSRVDGGQVELQWTVSCSDPGDDYGVYSGALGDFGQVSALTCSTGGNRSFRTAEGGDRFYLVVPSAGTVEGSYGHAGDGSERTPAAAACFPQQVATCP